MKPVRSSVACEPLSVRWVCSLRASALLAAIGYFRCAAVLNNRARSDRTTLLLSNDFSSAPLTSCCDDPTMLCGTAPNTRHHHSTGHFSSGGSSCKHSVVSTSCMLQLTIRFTQTHKITVYFDEVGPPIHWGAIALDTCSCKQSGITQHSTGRQVIHVSSRGRGAGSHEQACMHTLTPTHIHESTRANMKVHKTYTNMKKYT